MAEISNVLGSGGYSGGFLGNLTSGLEAIQMTEIQRRINDIQQQKAWDRDDRLRNEKFALDMALPKIAQDRRLALANETAKKVSDYNKQLVEFSKVADSGARMSDEERMKKHLSRPTVSPELLERYLQQLQAHEAFAKLNVVVPYFVADETLSDEFVRGMRNISIMLDERNS